jgi:uncharacterized protein (TIGR03435 family)
MRAPMLLLFLAGVAFAQDARTLAHQDRSAPAAFEVASVKSNPLPVGSFGFGPGGGGGESVKISGNRVTCVQNSLARLIMAAYNVKDFQVSGIPDWARRGESYYDITAKTEGEGTPTWEQVRPMLQALLADRFQLKSHREQKELAAYDLVVGKNAAKLKPSTGPRPPVPPKYNGPGPLIEFNLLDRPMTDLILFVSTYLDRPVFDKTGITGRYDFTLEFVRNPSAAPDSLDADRSIFKALQDQLGLKIVPAREPTEIIVIDHVERPAAN